MTDFQCKKAVQWNKLQMSIAQMFRDNVRKAIAHIKLILARAIIIQH